MNSYFLEFENIVLEVGDKVSIGNTHTFFYIMREVTREAQDNGNSELYMFCNELIAFMQKGTFTNYRKARELLMYWDCPISYIAERNGMSESAVKNALRTMSEDIYSYLGYDFFRLLYKGDDKSLDEARFRVRIAEKGYNSQSFVFSDVILRAKREGIPVNDIEVSSCAEEIKFLLNHSKQRVDRELANLDMDKLLYLIRMLDNEVDSPLNMRNFIKLFEKENING